MPEAGLPELRGLLDGGEQEPQVQVDQVWAQRAAAQRQTRPGQQHGLLLRHQDQADHRWLRLQAGLLQECAGKEEGEENLRGEGETFSGTFARARRLLPLISFFFFATT